MFKVKKEKKVCDLLETLIATVEKCVCSSGDSVRFYLDEKREELEKAAVRVGELEREADGLWRQIYQELSAGAFLPILRGDIHNLVEQVDDLADVADDLNDFIVNERPDIPKTYFPSLLLILAKTEEQINLIHLGITRVFSGVKSKTGEINEILQISNIEHEVDLVEKDLLRAIFSSRLDLAKKLHLKQFVSTLTDISDDADDVADSLKELVVKMKV